MRRNGQQQKYIVTFTDQQKNTIVAFTSQQIILKPPTAKKTKASIAPKKNVIRVGKIKAAKMLTRITTIEKVKIVSIA